MTDLGFPPHRRLKRRSEFKKVYETGGKLIGRHLVLFFLPNPDAPTRLGITATRKNGSATVRNRLKRLARESFRLRPRPDGLSVVVNFRAGAPDGSFDEIRTDLDRLLERAAKREP